MRCLVSGCGYKHNRKKKMGVDGVCLFNFPKDEFLRLKWFELCAASNLARKLSKPLVCSRHFKETDYTIKSRLGFAAKGGVRHLLPEAVPTLHMPTPEQCKSALIEATIKTESKEQNNGSLEEFLIMKNNAANISSNPETEIDQLKRKLRQKEKEVANLQKKLNDYETDLKNLRHQNLSLQIQLNFKNNTTILPKGSFVQQVNIPIAQNSYPTAVQPLVLQQIPGTPKILPANHTLISTSNQNSKPVKMILVRKNI